MNNNRRYFLRISVALDAQIRTTDGSDFAVKIVDLSDVGIKISCNKTVAFSILPAGQQSLGSVYDVDLGLLFNLPDNSRHKIDCSCRVVFSIRLAQDKFLFGLLINEIDAEDLRQIKDYVQEQVLL